MQHWNRPGSHITGGWRTLTYAEWCYVISNRPDASSKRGAATVCGVHGMILLPDDWQGSGFNAVFHGWSTNVYDAALWAEMEASGAVFLSAAGSRFGSEVDDVGYIGFYWSATPSYDDYAYAYDCYFSGGSVSSSVSSRGGGQSVRLARDNN